MDISTLNTVAACNKGAEIEIKHPIDNVGIGVLITLLGKDSDAFKEHTRTSINTRIRREAFAAKRGKESEIRTIEQIEAENVETLAVCTVGWRSVDEGESKPVITMDGVDYPCTPANATMVYSKYPFIYEQVNSAIAELENFMTV